MFSTITTYKRSYGKDAITRIEKGLLTALRGKRDSKTYYHIMDSIDELTEEEITSIHARLEEGVMI